MHHNAWWRRVWDSKQGWPVGLYALWTVCPVSYPLKPPSAGRSGHIPLLEVDSGTRFRVELSQTVLRPKLTYYSFLSTFFHDMCFEYS